MTRNRRQSGDTLVEVMLAIIVLSIVVTSTYVLSNRAQRLGISSQEKGEANFLVEQQIEYLRAVHKVDSYSPVRDSIRGGGGVGAQQCLKVDGSGDVVRAGPVSWASDCQVGNIPFKISIGNAVAADTFAVQAEWVGIGGEIGEGNNGDQLLRVLVKVR